MSHGQMQRYAGASYIVCNEPLTLIDAGLRTGATGEALAVHGSGDVPLAISTFSEEVIAVDISREQFGVGKYHRSLFEEYHENDEDLVEFLEPPTEQVLYPKILGPRRAYFNAKQDHVRPENIYQERTDIRDLPPRVTRKSFDSVYLSNVLDRCDDIGDVETIVERMRSGGRVIQFRNEGPSLLDSVSALERLAHVNVTSHAYSAYLWEADIYERR